MQQLENHNSHVYFSDSYVFPENLNLSRDYSANLDHSRDSPENLNLSQDSPENLDHSRDFSENLNQSHYSQESLDHSRDLTEYPDLLGDVTENLDHPRDFTIPENEKPQEKSSSLDDKVSTFMLKRVVLKSVN